MKRSQLNRKTPITRGAAPSRRTRVKAVNPERRAEKYARNYGPEADAVRAMPCLVFYALARDGKIGGFVDVTCAGDTVAAHVTARGMGAAKGGRMDLVPLCDAHHREAGESGTSQRAAFEQRYGLDLRAEADRIALGHEPPLGIRGLVRVWLDGRAAAVEAMGEYGDGVSERQLFEWVFQVDEYSGDALLGWVRRSMHEMVAADLAVFGEPPTVAGPFDDGDKVVFVVTQRGPAPCRESLAHAIMTKLGWETLGSDPHGEHGLAWLLCEVAGWPEVSS